MKGLVRVTRDWVRLRNPELSKHVEWGEDVGSVQVFFRKLTAAGDHEVWSRTKQSWVNVSKCCTCRSATASPSEIDVPTQ
jgi:hypothetical protein